MNRMASFSAKPFPSCLPALLSRFLRSSLLSYEYWCVLLGTVLTGLLLWSAGTAGLLSPRLIVGIIGEAFAAGWILWAVLYSAARLEKEVPRFVRLMPEDQGKAEKWVSSEIRKIYSGPMALTIMGLMTVGLMSTVWLKIGAPPDSGGNPQSWLGPFHLSFLVFSLIAGFGTSTVVLIGRFMTRYAERDLKFSVYQQPFSHFRFIGLLQLHFAWITAVGFVFGSIMTVFYWRLQPATLFWIIFGTVVVIGFFIGPQYGFHRKLKEEKRLELEKVSEMIQEAFSQSLQLQKVLPRLEELHRIAGMVEKLPEWPFDARFFISALASGVLPTLVPIVKLLLEVDPIRASLSRMF